LLEVRGREQPDGGLQGERDIQDVDVSVAVHIPQEKRRRSPGGRLGEGGTREQPCGGNTGERYEGSELHKHLPDTEKWNAVERGLPPQEELPRVAYKIMGTARADEPACLPPLFYLRREVVAHLSRHKIVSRVTRRGNDSNFNREGRRI
jgi:hypothetical protein